MLRGLAARASLWLVRYSGAEEPEADGWDHWYNGLANALSQGGNPQQLMVLPSEDIPEAIDHYSVTRLVNLGN